MAFNPLNLLRRQSEEEYYDDYEPENEYEEEAYGYREESVAPSMSFMGNDSRIMVLAPKKYADRMEIADAILGSKVVVLNLTDMYRRDEDTARRIVDFVAGVAYAQEAVITDITANKQVKLVSPKFVDISKMGINFR